MSCLHTSNTVVCVRTSSVSLAFSCICAVIQICIDKQVHLAENFSVVFSLLSLIDCFLVDSAAVSLAMSPTGDFLASTHVDDLGIYLW